MCRSAISGVKLGCLGKYCVFRKILGIWGNEGERCEFGKMKGVWENAGEFEKLGVRVELIN